MLTSLLLCYVLQSPALPSGFPTDGHPVQRPGIPGTLCVFGPEARAVLTSGGGRPAAVAAVAQAGKGRLFAIAHNGYFAPSFFEDPAGLMASALDWLRRGQAPGRVAYLGRAGAFTGALEARGYESQAINWDQLASLQLLIVEGEGPVAPEHLQALDDWLQDGGAVLAAICPWGWQQIHGGQGWDLTRDMAANQILGPHGLLFTDGYSDAARDDKFIVDHDACSAVNCQGLVEALRSGKTPDSLAALESALRVLPADDSLLLPQLTSLLPELKGSNVPTPQHPLKSKPDSLLRLAVIAQDRRLQAADPANPLVAPSADSFPGAVPSDAQRLDRELTFDPEQTGWQSTGLYLAPGEVLELEASSGTLRGWSYRVGAHADRLWHKQKWPRWPNVSRTGDLGEARSSAISSPFGGLIYLQVESGARPSAQLKLRLKGAVAAAWWRSGQTTPEQWKQMREAPAPWAELQGKYLILTLPSRAVRELDDPTDLMAWWDRVVQEQFKLAGEPAPQRPERFVPDVLISAGYMHSGYPVMMHLDVAEPRANGQPAVLVDLQELKTKGCWGCFHELGHNRQKPAWTFGGTGEVTNNLFSLYCGEVMSAIEPWTNPWLEGQKKSGRAYLEQGADFQQWRKKPGVALLCYAEVQHAFGWEPFREVFRRARSLRGAARPNSDLAKQSFWVRSLSLATKHDLRAFHKHWGWPLAAELLSDEQLDSLPEWMPEESL